MNKKMVKDSPLARATKFL